MSLWPGVGGRATPPPPASRGGSPPDRSHSPAQTPAPCNPRQLQYTVNKSSKGKILLLFRTYHRRRIKTEEKAKVLAAAWREGAELIKFLAKLAILHQDDLKNRMNHTRTI